MRIGLSLLAGLMMAAGAVQGAEHVASSPLHPGTISVGLFKNGLGFVTREANWPSGQASVVIEGLPVPVHGTFWIYAPGHADALREAIAARRDAIESVSVSSLSDVIDANIGRIVEVRASGQEPMRGKILPPPTPLAPASADALEESERVNPYGALRPVLLLETSRGTVALERSAIQQILGVEGALNTRFERPLRRASIELRGSGGGRVLIQCLARGITWVPSYALELGAGKTARLTAKAEVINELEDLSDANLQFITGYPNLQFSDVNDPMGLRGDLAAFLGALQSGGGAGVGGAYRGRAAVMSQMAAVDNETAPFPAYSTTPPTGQSIENLFFYEHKGVTLAKGERAYYPLFTLEVPAEPRYELVLEDPMSGNDGYEGLDPGAPRDVWFSMRLTNTSRLPWTTAPVMTVRDGQLLSQDQVNFTSVGAHSSVRITKAVDVKALVSEVELDRKREAARFFGYSYDAVEIQGTVSVENFKDEAITLGIKKDLSGEVVQTTPEAKVERLLRGLKAVNPNARLTWDVPLKPHQKLEVGYRYRVFVRQ